MSKIKSKDTKPELRLRRALWATGLRYRTHVKKLPGNPDIVIRKYKLAIFVDGEFWHGHNWEQKKQRLATNKEFWIPKIERNQQRDRENNVALQALGFTIFRFWEGDVKKRLGICVKQIVDFIVAKRVAAGMNE